MASGSPLLHHPQPALCTVLSRTWNSHRESDGSMKSGFVMNSTFWNTENTYIPSFRPAGNMFFSLIFFDIILYQLFENSVEVIFIKFPAFHTLTLPRFTPASPVPSNFEFSDLRCKNTWRQNSQTSVFSISWKHWLPWHSYLSRLSILSL